MDSDAKIRKEQMVSNLDGTSAFETLYCISTIFPVFFCVVIKAQNCLPSGNLYSQYALELLAFGVYLVCSLSLFSDHSELFGITALTVVAIVALMLFRIRLKYKNVIDLFPGPVGQRGFINGLRGSTMLFTCLCILAVDFHIFPRRFAKTETFGYSLMDVGVGCFVFSNAIVAAHVQEKPRRQMVWRSLARSLPLFILGILRFIVLKNLGYQEHVTEYGTHWNFFLTLGAVQVLLPFIPGDPLLMAFGIAFFQEFVLSSSSFAFWTNQQSIKDWIIAEGNRGSNFFSANREGIFSIPGYMSIALFGFAYGRLLLQPCRSLKLYMQLFWKLSLHVILWGISWYGSETFVADCSRRLCNLTYVFWIVFFNLLFLLPLLLFDLYVFHASSLKRKNKGTLFSSCPLVIQALTSNGLPVFLLANVLTGLINLNVDTSSITNQWVAVSILSAYATVLEGIALVLHQNGIRLKFW